METAVKQRIKVLLEAKKATLNSIANGDTALKMALSRQVNGTTAISQVTISLLLSKFPDLSAEWLLRGTGEMLISSVVLTEGQPREHRENTDQIVDANKKVLEQIQELAAAQKEAYAAAINEKDDKIQELKYYVELQKDYIDGQKKTIEKLEQFVEHLQEENRELKKAHSTASVTHARSV